jgi:hypothetical protein
MYRILIAGLCVLVAAIQIGIWVAAERRNDFAQRLARIGKQAPGQVTKADAQIINGRSNYVVNYTFQADGRELDGEELLSLRQPDRPKAGANVTVYYDPQDVELNTISDPRIAINRLATMKMMTLGFGAFTYAFLWVIWKSNKQEEAEALATAARRPTT